MLTCREPATGVEFPLVQKVWGSEEMRCMGAGCRTKKIAFIGVKVYAVALYVEAEKMARELGVRNRCGGAVYRRCTAAVPLLYTTAHGSGAAACCCAGRGKTDQPAAVGALGACRKSLPAYACPPAGCLLLACRSHTLPAYPCCIYPPHPTPPHPRPGRAQGRLL